MAKPNVMCVNEKVATNRDTKKGTMANTKQRHNTACVTHEVVKPHLSRSVRNKSVCDNSNKGVSINKDISNIATHRNLEQGLNTLCVDKCRSVGIDQSTPIVNNNRFWPLIDSCDGATVAEW